VDSSIARIPLVMVLAADDVVGIHDPADRERERTDRPVGHDHRRYTSHMMYNS
jgi:hypothetical protein